MKKMIRQFAIVILSVLAIGTLSAQKTGKSPQVTELYLSVNMDCHSCETKLTEHLKFEKGVKDLKCDFKSNTIYVKYKTGSNSTDKIVKSVEDLDYKALEISKELYLEKMKHVAESTH